MKIIINPKYESLRSWIEQIPDTFDQDGDILYDARNRIRAKSAPDGQLMCVKRFCCPTFVNRLAYSFLRKPKAQRAYENAQILLSHQIGTPEPVAYILTYRNHLLAESYLVTLQSALTHTFYELGDGILEGRETLIQSFARFTAHMHDEGIYHLDYSPGNILFDQVNGEWHFELVDINRLQTNHSIDMQKGCRNFARLWGRQQLHEQIATTYAQYRHMDPEQCRQIAVQARTRFWEHRRHSFFVYDGITNRKPIRPEDIVIVIPIYKASLSQEEQISVSQCLRLLSRYTIRFAGPESVKQVNSFPQIPIEHFPDTYFQDLATYNRLMLSKEFYQRFNNFEYLLIYQTDAFVFRDELLQWASLGYSYIGAPWILKPFYRTPFGRLWLRLRGLKYTLHKRPFRPLLLGDKVGNGGLSLRHIPSFIYKCENDQTTIQHYLEKSQIYTEFNEDAYWATRSDFRYPEAGFALEFAFDIRPQECLKQTAHRLPFGCHGWTKPENRDFWYPVILRQIGQEPLRVYFDFQAFSHQTFGGVSRYFAEIISRLPQYNITPILGIRYSDNTHLQALHINVEPVPNRKMAKRRNRQFCRLQIAEGQFDMIHTTYFDPYILKANTHHRPLLITIHDMIDEVMKEGHTTPRRKALLAGKATHIIAVSRHTKQDVMNLLHLPDNKISVVYHGCSISPSTPQQMPALPDKYILYVGGRQRLYKNFRLFLQAMSSVVASEKIDIVCVGSPFTPQEKEYIRSLGLQDHIHSFFAQDDQLYYIYHHAACFVFPSCYEGFGLPILEAWEAQCPLILSNSSCFPEIAADAAQYFLQNDAEDLKSQILTLLHHPERCRELTQKGKKRLQMYSWDKAAESIARIYHNLYARYV